MRRISSPTGETQRCRRGPGDHRYCISKRCTCWCHTKVAAWRFDGLTWHPMREVKL